MACLKPGRPGRYFYRVRVHRRRKGDRASMSEADYAALVTAAHHALNAPVVLVWDNLTTHRSQKMRQFTEASSAWLTVIYLPGYAPDLNAVEGAWASMKAAWAITPLRPSTSSRPWSATGSAASSAGPPSSTPSSARPASASKPRRPNRPTLTFQTPVIPLRVQGVLIARAGMVKPAPLPTPAALRLRQNTAMARLHDVVFDCRHPASIARFWAAVLDGYQVAPYDEAELARLRSEGILDPEDDPSVLVEAPGDRPRIFFQRVAGQKTAKNRIHLDLRCDRLEDELERLRQLGASVVSEYDDHLVLRDPEGNEFCLSRRS